MKMKKVQTSTLIDDALIWAVAKCEGFNVTADESDLWDQGLIEYDEFDNWNWDLPNYLNWDQGGPIIYRNGIMIAEARNKKFWIALKGPVSDFGIKQHYEGATPLVAAMRCRVASELGEEIEIPDNLI